MISLFCKSSDAVTIPTAKARDMKAGSKFLNRFAYDTFPDMITSSIIQLFRLKFNWVIDINNSYIFLFYIDNIYYN